MNMAQTELPQKSRSSGDLKHISDLMRDFSIEVTPGAARNIGDFRAHLRPGDMGLRDGPARIRFR